MSQNDKEDNFPLPTTLVKKRKAQEESVNNAMPSKKKPAEKQTSTQKPKGDTVEARQRMATKKRTLNFAVDDDIALCKAYVNCTLNPLVGNDQKAEVFWNAALQAYNDINSNYSTAHDMIVVEIDSAPLKNRFHRSIAQQTKEWHPF
jgi:hypothetical protein